MTPEEKAECRRIDMILEDISKEYLHVYPLETRGNDARDFHDVPVWGIKKALAAAYEAGRKSAAGGFVCASCEKHDTPACAVKITYECYEVNL